MGGGGGIVVGGGSFIIDMGVLALVMEFRVMLTSPPELAHCG